MEEIRKDLAQEGLSPRMLVGLVLYAVALAMGVMTIVLPMLSMPIDQSLTGIALVCFGIVGLDQITEYNQPECLIQRE